MVDLGKIAITLEGDYDTNITYKKLDVVSYQGGSYASQIDNNSAPLSDTLAWQKIAEKGEKGDDGANVLGITDKAVVTSSPTPWVPGNPDLFEIYAIDSAGTYTNFTQSNTSPIIVSSADLASNTVQIWVKNGVSEKVMKPILQPTQYIPTFIDSIFPITSTTSNPAQRIYNDNIWQLKTGQIAQSTDIPGVSDKWVKVVNSEKDIIALSDDLFFVESNVIDNQMQVVRRLTDGTLTTLANGTYQSYDGDFVHIDPPTSGSQAIAYYFKSKTEIKQNETIILNFQYNSNVVTLPVSGTCGIGVINGTLVSNYTIAYNGIVRKLVNNVSQDLTTAIISPSISDTFLIKIEESIIYCYMNDNLLYSENINPIFLDKNAYVLITGYNDRNIQMNVKIGDFLRNLKSELAQGKIFNDYFEFNAASKTFTAYTKLEDNSFIGFNIVNEINTTDIVYVNYWRITKALGYNIVNGAMVLNGKKFIEEGESECVFKQNASKDDFTGGVHGDEQVVIVKFFAGGVEIKDLTNNIPLTICSDFKYAIKSTMHETAQGGVFVPGHPVIAEHVKITTIKNGGYTTYNELHWKFSTSTLVTLWYHGIACIAKDTATFYSLDEKLIENFIQASGSNQSSPELSGKSIMNAYSVGLSAFVDSKCWGSDLTNEETKLFVIDRNVDTKYYRRTNPKNVINGDIWYSEMEVKFRLKK